MQKFQSRGGRNGVAGALLCSAGPEQPWSDPDLPVRGSLGPGFLAR